MRLNSLSPLTFSDDYVTTARTLVMESLNQGSAYMSENLPKLLSSSSSNLVKTEQEEDLEQDYLPTQTKENDKVLEEAAEQEADAPSLMTVATKTSEVELIGKYEYIKI
jgi:hypothetical protein